MATNGFLCKGRANEEQKNKIMIDKIGLIEILSNLDIGCLDVKSANEKILSLLGEKESALSDTKLEHDPLHSVRECNAERVEQEKVSVKNPLGKITDTESSFQFVCKCGFGTNNSRTWCTHADCCTK